MKCMECSNCESFEDCVVLISDDIDKTCEGEPSIIVIPSCINIILSRIVGNKHSDEIFNEIIHGMVKKYRKISNEDFVLCECLSDRKKCVSKIVKKWNIELLSEYGYKFN